MTSASAAITCKVLGMKPLSGKGMIELPVLANLIKTLQSQFIILKLYQLDINFLQVYDASLEICKY